MKYKRVVFDLDGTLCNNTNGLYEIAQPYKEMIDIVNGMYDAGCYIVIQTARGYGRFNGNLGLIYKQWYSMTQKQLDDWNVKYHELRLGKVESDLFVDDKAFRVNEDGTTAKTLKDFLGL